MGIILAAPDSGGSTWGVYHLLIAGAVFIVVLLLIGVIVVPWIRKRYDPRAAGPRSGNAFDYNSLEKLRQQGLMTDEEFRRLRRVAMGLDIKPTNTDNSASSAPVGRDDEDSENPAAGPQAEADDNDEERLEEL